MRKLYVGYSEPVAVVPDWLPHREVFLMATAKDLRRIALSLEGTTEAQHFDRTAFRVSRIYVTLAADGRTANFMFTPDEQEFKCMMLPDAFAPVPNAWGKKGATEASLSKLTTADLKGALEMAWRRARQKKRASQ
jgi:hypothetical protein